MRSTLAIANAKVKQMLIYQTLNSSSNSRMNIEEYRQKRLAELIDRLYKGKPKAFADATGYAEARISQLLSPNYRGNGVEFGERAARNLEKAARLEVMYFDRGFSPVARPLTPSGEALQVSNPVEAIDKHGDGNLFSADEVIELLALFQQANERERENILDLARSIAKRNSLRWIRSGKN